MATDARILFAPQPTDSGSIVPTSRAAGPGPSHLHKIGRLILVVLLVSGIAVIATILIRTETSLQSTQADLVSTQRLLTKTQISLKSTQDRLQSTAGQLKQRQAQLVVGTQVSDYAATFLLGFDTFGASGAFDACAVQRVVIADCEAAIDKEAAAATAFGSQLSGLAVPAPMSSADQETRHGLALLASALVKMRAAAASHDWRSYNAGVDLANAANSYLNDAWNLVVTALRASTSS